MSSGPPTGYEQLPPSLAQTIDEACDRFEQAWRAGQRPLIENFLAQAPEPARPVLLRELILVEMPYRQRVIGELPLAEYQARFPHLESNWLQQVLGMATRLDRGPAPAVGKTGPPRLPGYQVLGEAGRGGMGVVYKARDIKLGRQVALKVLPADAAREPGRLDRFHREARAAGALNHPAICTVHALEEWQGQPVLVLEWIEGQTLRAMAPQRPELRLVLDWLAQAAQALQAAHAAGIAHRDIKPENIMVRADGLIKVLDFGLARLLGPDGMRPLGQDTAPGVVLGTVHYMSPEQARGAPVGSPTDVFSLGVVLYEMSTGQLPFQSSSLGGLLQAIELHQPTLPSLLNGDVSPALETLILGLLAKDPGQRPKAGAAAAMMLGLRDRTSLVNPALATVPQVQRPAPRRRIPPWFLWTAVAVVLCSLTLWGLSRLGGPIGQMPNVKPDPQRDDQARKHLDEVIAKLKALNPQFDGERQYKIQNGAVVELTIMVDPLINVAPLAELKDLQALHLAASDHGAHTSKLSDISPLKNLRLRKFTLQGTQVRSLVDCADMPLEELDIDSSIVSSLAPVADKKLVNLRILGTRIQDVTPVRHMRLREAVLGVSSFDDLTVLENSDLTYLSLHGAERISKLDGLERMKKLTKLSLNSTPINSLEKLRGLPIEELDLGQCSSLKDLAPLAGMKTLRDLNVLSTPIVDFTPLQTTGVEFLTGVANPRAHEKTLRGIPNLRRLNGNSLPTIFPN